MAGKLLPKKLIEKYNTIPVTLKATFWFTVCNFMLKGISFICMPLYSRILPKDEYGTMSLITSYELIFIIFATFELYLGAYQRGLLKFKNDVKLFEQSIVFLSNIISVICFVIVLIFNKPFENFTGISVAFFSMFTLYFITYTPYNCWLNKKRFEYDYKAAVFVTILMALASNFLPIITVKLFGATAFVKVLSTLIIQTLFCLPFWIIQLDIKSFIKRKNDIRKYLVYALKFQGPLLFHSLSYYILNQSDRVMIDKFSNTNKSDVALYSVAYSFASVIIIFQTSLNQVLRPWRFQKLDKKQYKDVRDISGILVVIVGTVIVLFMLILPEVFKFAFTSEYYEALKVVPSVTAGVYFLFLYTLFVDVESYYGKTNYIAYVSTFCAIINIALNYIGIKMFGYIACAYTTLICYVIMAFLHYVFMLITCKKASVEEKPVNGSAIWLFSGVILIIFVIVNIIYDYIFIRYSLFAIIAVAILVFHKKIINEWKRLKAK